ncbi:MAG: hypothetical protein IV092_22330 [Burkholderiaceae bacterium]|nr:hypothetical protein [Burkholderiaceae bacterium]
MYKPYAHPDTPGTPPRGPALRCPCCQGPVQRIPRRLIDRLRSLFSPVQRFRCPALPCGWLGNLPTSDRSRDQPSDGSNYII